MESSFSEMKPKHNNFSNKSFLFNSFISYSLAIINTTEFSYFFTISLSVSFLEFLMFEQLYLVVLHIF